MNNNYLYRIFDTETNKYLKIIYNGFKIFEFTITPFGSLLFRCKGMEDKGFPDGEYHESIITQNKNRFVLEWNI